MEPMDDPEVRRLMELFDRLFMAAFDPRLMEGMEVVIENDRPILVTKGDTVEDGGHREDISSPQDQSASVPLGLENEAGSGGGHLGGRDR